ncbi:hypothetical protein V6N12_055936 [Hibiscus sabdariffa]|uniref:Uncharacterized protein n=1 Tax=Hibiscus sabdariffa TaxID=183260 RepID=A0ABR2CR04_9ROSI
MAMAFTVAVVDTEYLKEIEKARRYLRAPIAFKNCAPIMLRLAWHWHWHGTGTARGLTMSTPRLQEREIQKWKHSGKHDEEVKAKHPRITYADLYQTCSVKKSRWCCIRKFLNQNSLDLLPFRGFHYMLRLDLYEKGLLFLFSYKALSLQELLLLKSLEVPLLTLYQEERTQTFVRKKDDFQMLQKVMQNHIRNFQNLGFNPSSSRPKLVVKDSTVLVHGAVVIFSYVHELFDARKEGPKLKTVTRSPNSQPGQHG